MQPNVALVCRLMVFTSVISVNAWITTRLSTPEGWKSWPSDNVSAARPHYIQWSLDGMVGQP